MPATVHAKLCASQRSTVKGLVDTANAKAASEKEQRDITIRDLQGQAVTLQSHVIEREAAEQKVAVS